MIVRAHARVIVRARDTEPIPKPRGALGESGAAIVGSAWPTSPSAWRVSNREDQNLKIPVAINRRMQGQSKIDPKRGLRAHHEGEMQPHSKELEER
jgi:hypothetical protein